MDFVWLVNGQQQTERLIIEAFRLLVFGVLVNPLPRPAYDALWATASWDTEARRANLEQGFALVIVTIEGIELVVTLLPEWFVAYNDAVESGDAPLDAPNPFIPIW